MKEHPIIYSTEMIRAYLDDRKTMTRRVIKPQPDLFRDGKPYFIMGDQDAFERYPYQLATVDKEIKCPYGQVGDRLWVREKHAIRNDGQQVMHYQGYVEISKALDLPNVEINWKPSIHMPRWASRLNQTITEIRVERLQDIENHPEDYKAEGYIPLMLNKSAIDGKPFEASMDFAWFEYIWDSINAKRGYSWESNPWVWVISYPKYSEEVSNE